MSPNLEFSGELPMFPSGWGSGSLSYTGGESFWAEIERVTAAGGFGDSLDGAMLGKAAPRVWLFLHGPGQGKLSASAAMGFARHLVGRGQAVLVLDGDDEESDLTRWSGRQHEEGWLDVVRYGVSLQAAGIPLPFGGRSSFLLGVGSFTPTDATDGEIDRVVTRLKRQADDLLVVAPTNVMGYKWAKVADLRLLCWDRANFSEGAVDLIAGDFAGIGFPLTSLVGFGFPEKNSSITMDGRTDLPFEKTEDRPSDPPAEVSGKNDNVEPDDLEKEFEDIYSELRGDSPESIIDDIIPEAVVVDESPIVDDDPVWDRTFSEKATGLASKEPYWDKSSEEVEYATRRGSSKVFWITIAASLAFIAMASVYYFQFIYIPPDGNFASVVTVASNSGGMTPNLGFDSDVPPAREKVIFREEDMVPDSVREKRDQSEEVVADTAPTRDESDTEEAKSKSDPLVVNVTPREEQVTKVVAKEEPVVKKVDRRQGFQMDPYLIPVGQEGYALHIYSFSDSLDALKQMRELELRGFQTAWRAVEIKGKGRYFRVFLGSFDSKSSAKAAQGDLLKKLHQDWARVARF